MRQDGIKWLPQEFELGFCVSFTKGIKPERLVRRFGADPDHLEPLSRIAVERLEGSYIRVGISGEWAFSIESWGLTGSISEISSNISKGTESIIVILTGDATSYFVLARDGEIACRFDGHIPEQRTGSSPDLLLPAMIEAGMLGGGKQAQELGIAPILSMVESEFSVGLSRHDILVGELPGARIR